MIGFLFFLTATVCFVLAVVIGSVNPLKGPKGKLIKDEMTANWIKEIDAPEEPLSDLDYKRLLRSYRVSMTNRPIYATILYIIGFFVVFIGWYADFSVFCAILEMIVIFVCATTHLVKHYKNQMSLESERKYFTKKMAVLLDTDRTSFLYTPRVAILSGKCVGEIYSMRIGVCNRDGEPRIYTIPILADLYSLAVKVEKFEVVMYKGKFSAMLAFMTEEEVEEEAENNF